MIPADSCFLWFNSFQFTCPKDLATMHKAYVEEEIKLVIFGLQLFHL
jgi:hypothetical protein